MAGASARPRTHAQRHGGGASHQRSPATWPGGSGPAAATASIKAIRSSNDSEFASLLVPRKASPQSCDKSQRQWATKRGTSTSSSEVKGVTTGESTPVIRSEEVMTNPDGLVAN